MRPDRRTTVRIPVLSSTIHLLRRTTVGLRRQAGRRPRRARLQLRTQHPRRMQNTPAVVGVVSTIANLNSD